MILLLIALSGLLFLGIVTVLIQNARVTETLRSLRDQSRSRDVEDEGRRSSLETTLKTLEERLRAYEGLLRDFEKERAQKFGHIEKELMAASQATTRLQETTGHLTNILGNVKLRGQWGERMAEDIIRYAGLLEGVNYQKQETLSSSGSRPDFVFLLPEGRVVNMDAKFPLDNYLRMVNAATETEKAAFEKEFLKNARARVKEVRGREYINPAENTLDFMILFIPNEQVYGFLQEKDPGLMDEALREKVILSSPFTLYAVLSVIRQAHEHFRFEKDIQKILGHVDIFLKHFETFKIRFGDLGGLIEKLDGKYRDVAEKSFKNIETKVRHIEQYKKGQGSEAVGVLPDPEEE
ncbi:MAG: DNA recombination protein RmuC [Elusimicrobia bacterium]|nr:DNA recombination protein RmuC [Elusimicrobiota bacterium]